MGVDGWRGILWDWDLNLWDLPWFQVVSARIAWCGIPTHLVAEVSCVSETRDTVPFFLDSVCHTYHEELWWRHLCEPAFHSILQELVDRTMVSFYHSMVKAVQLSVGPHIFDSPDRLRCHSSLSWTLCPWNTHSIHQSALYLPLPQLVLTRHTAHALNLDRRVMLPLQCCLILGTGPGADSGEFSILLLILLFHSHETQTASNTLPHLALMSYRGWVLLSENPASFFVCPYEKLKCSQSLETNFRVNCIWTFKILPPPLLVKSQWSRRWS